MNLAARLMRARDLGAQDIEQFMQDADASKPTSAPVKAESSVYDASLPG